MPCRILTCFSRCESHLSSLLRTEGYEVRESSSENIIPSLDETIDAVLLDTAGIPGYNLVSICRKMQESRPDVPILLLSDPESNEGLLRDMMTQGCSVLFRPYHLLTVLSAVKQGMQIARHQRDVSMLKSGLGHTALRESIASVSNAGRKLDVRIAMFAKSSGILLIEGERGCGKSSVAQRLHRERNGDAPFYAISCDTILQDSLEEELFGNERPGKLELITDGTVFFDHVDELSPRLQERLSEFLKLQKFGFRVIASTKRGPLSGSVRQRLFKDLAPILEGMVLSVPPLRKRIEDIPAFSRLFLERLARHNNRPVKELSSGVLEKLQEHLWPKNLKELESVLRAAADLAENGAITKGTIVFKSDHPLKSESTLAGRTLESVTKQLLQETLDACNGNRSQAAQILDVSEKTVYNRIHRYRLEKVV